MINKLIILLSVLILFSCGQKSSEKEEVKEELKVGLLIIDTQKWFIPGHAESLYKVWNINDYERGDKEIIVSVSRVLDWANDEELPVVVTYEGLDTGRHDMPDELKLKLDTNRTTHYVKFFFGALKHKKFEEIIDRSGVDHWVVVGAETDVCVYQTVKGLLAKNMKVALVTDALFSGKNNPEVALSNLVSFGADTVSFDALTDVNSLFKSTEVQLEEKLDVDQTVLTILSDSTQVDLDTGYVTRLQQLIDYAKILDLPIEYVSTDEFILPDTLHTRLLAGNLTPARYDKIASLTDASLLVVSDCVALLPFEKQPENWRKQTLKIMFYEFLESADFYVIDVEKHKGWKKRLKIAFANSTFNYTESSQNL